MSHVVDTRVRQAFLCVSERLLDERQPGGHWEGELSASALSTATAVFALFCVHQQAPTNDLAHTIQRGRDWLLRYQNADGGWGDTIDSPSNLSTTVLCWAALSAVGRGKSPLTPLFQRGEQRPYGPPAEGPRQAVHRAERWITQHAGGLDRQTLSNAIQGIYGVDRTFSIPILVMCALAGYLDEDDDDNQAAWNEIPSLPFELAIFPRRWYKHLGLPVVSYALPALIAIGQTQHHHCPSRLPPLRWLRNLCRAGTLRLLEEIQPASGGFLEAIPLTSFVTMSLARVPGCGELPVIQRCAEFLKGSIRPDGSWPIDINLATWGTTLAVGALASPESPELLTSRDRRRLTDWLLAQHHVDVHPFTLADPGGWAWTDLTGGVPDADDTAGALLALARLAPAGQAADMARVRNSAELAASWLVDLQNRDGGIPTFCRGWGKLPFDRSSPDLTAHALRAWHAWRGRLSPSTERRVRRATRRAVSFLERGQQDSCWVPLWFGNQAAPGNQNPTYGTARVVLALAVAGLADEARGRGVDWLLTAQHEGGGWGGAPGVTPSVEETALALEALGAVRQRWPSAEVEDAGQRGLAYLMARIEAGDLDRPAPIGLYFADLWYSEKLYPLCFSAAALGRWT